MKRGLGPLLLILQLVLQVLHRLVAGEAVVLAAGRGLRLGPGSAPRDVVIAECAQFDLCAAVGAGDEPADGCRRVLAELLGDLSSAVRTLDLRHRRSSHSRDGHPRYAQDNVLSPKRTGRGRAETSRLSERYIASKEAWMFPSSFDYVAPTSVEEVLSLLAEHGEDAKVLAGGPVSYTHLR